jgi:hypothetical protein
MQVSPHINSFAKGKKTFLDANLLKFVAQKVHLALPKVRIKTETISANY